MKRRVVADGIIQMGLTYRLKLNKVQTGTLETWIKVSRLLYNELLEKVVSNFRKKGVAKWSK